MLWLKRTLSLVVVGVWFSIDRFTLGHLPKSAPKRLSVVQSCASSEWAACRSASDSLGIEEDGRSVGSAWKRKGLRRYG